MQGFRVVGFWGFGVLGFGVLVLGLFCLGLRVQRSGVSSCCLLNGVLETGLLYMLPYKPFQGLCRVPIVGLGVRAIRPRSGLKGITTLNPKPYQLNAMNLLQSGALACGMYEAPFPS